MRFSHQLLFMLYIFIKQYTLTSSIFYFNLFIVLAGSHYCPFTDVTGKVWVSQRETLLDSALPED